MIFTSVNHMEDFPKIQMNDHYNTFLTLNEKKMKDYSIIYFKF